MVILYGHLLQHPKVSQSTELEQGSRLCFSSASPQIRQRTLIITCLTAPQRNAPHFRPETATMHTNSAERGTWIIWLNEIKMKQNRNSDNRFLAECLDNATQVVLHTHLSSELYDGRDEEYQLAVVTRLRWVRFHSSEFRALRATCLLRQS